MIKDQSYCCNKKILFIHYDEIANEEKRLGIDNNSTSLSFLLEMRLLFPNNNGNNSNYIYWK
jgi:hypothetical protein